MTNSGKIFLVDGKPGDLTPMEETPYDTEDVLQVLLAEYPDLLPGDQITPEDPRRWLLVAREMSVPGEEGGSGVWSLDHLFLDQDGIPTFVECKRATDTRIRREVVAQMLDYAANGTAYWSMDRLRQAAAESARERGASLDQEIVDLVGGDGSDVEEYWNRVEENLRSGRVRLIFVADKTPPELRRLVEFLNDNMAQVEVLAVEIKQFLSDGRQVVVPRVIGLTEAARTKKKSAGPKMPTNRTEFLSKCSPSSRLFFERVLDESLSRGHSIYWGTLGFSARARVEGDQGLASFVYGYPANTFEFYFGQLPMTEGVASSLRQELLGYGIFTEAGQHTLRSQVTGETLNQAGKVLGFILDRVDNISATM